MNNELKKKQKKKKQKKKKKKQKKKKQKKQKKGEEIEEIEGEMKVTGTKFSFKFVQHKIIRKQEDCYEITLT